MITYLPVAGTSTTEEEEKSAWGQLSSKTEGRDGAQGEESKRRVERSLTLTQNGLTSSNKYSVDEQWSTGEHNCVLKQIEWERQSQESLLCISHRK